MEESAVNPLNGGVNPLNAGVPNSVGSFATNGSLSPEGSLLTGGSNLLLGNGNNPIPGGGINPFAGDAGSGLQKLIFDRLKLVLGDNFFKGIDNTLAGGSNPFANSGYPIPSGATSPLAGGSNPFAGGGNAIAGGSNPFAGGGNAIAGGSNPFAGGGNAIAGGSNPFAGGGNAIAGAGSLLQQSPFDPLKEVLGNNIPFSNGGNTFNPGSQTFNEGNAPVGNGNKNLGSNNATIGNFNSDYGSDSATIGNGNWNSQEILRNRVAKPLTASFLLKVLVMTLIYLAILSNFWHHSAQFKGILSIISLYKTLSLSQNLLLQCHC